MVSAFKKKKKKKSLHLPRAKSDVIKRTSVPDTSILLLLALNSTPEVELQVSSDSNRVKHSCFSDFTDACIWW